MKTLRDNVLAGDFDNDEVTRKVYRDDKTEYQNTMITYDKRRKERTWRADNTRGREHVDCGLKKSP